MPCAMLPPLQGGEAEVVIFSATASDPAALARNSDFYANLNRANVALSRAQRRMVVVAARSMLGHMPSRAEQYQQMGLWKQLVGKCRARLCNGVFGQARVEVWAWEEAAA